MNAHPTQGTFFSSTNACGSWDYDCSGASEFEDLPTPIATCRGSSAMCSTDGACGAPGWRYGPTRGETARNVRCFCDLVDEMNTCDGSTIDTQTLKCH